MPKRLTPEDDRPPQLGKLGLLNEIITCQGEHTARWLAGPSAGGADEERWRSQAPAEEAWFKANTLFPNSTATHAFTSARICNHASLKGLWPHWQMALSGKHGVVHIHKHTCVRLLFAQIHKHNATTATQ